VRITEAMDEIPWKNPRAIDVAYHMTYPQETKWQREVEKWFKQMGWITYHTWNSMNSKAGFPDLIAVLPGVALIWAELKTEKGKLDQEQESWLLSLAKTGEMVYLWRPSDTDEIQQVLQDCHVLSRQFLQT
jgi:hypothetical protein